MKSWGNVLLIKLYTNMNEIITTVRMLNEHYFVFKRNIIGYKMTLQKLVNRSIYLYNKDEDFKKLIDETKIKEKQDE